MVGNNKSHSVKNHSEYSKTYFIYEFSQNDGFDFIDNIILYIGQGADIPIGTKCAAFPGDA